MLRRVLLSVALGVTVTACGQLGPLYQPPAAPQQEPTDPAAS